MYIQYSRFYVLLDTNRKVKEKKQKTIYFNNSNKQTKSKPKKTIQKVGYYRCGFMKLLNTILINFAKFFTIKFTHN